MSASSRGFGEVSAVVAEASSDVICFLTRDLRITYCNPAWDRFARENGGEGALAAKVVGSTLLAHVPAEMHAFFRTVFGICADDDDHFSFDYECSSMGTFRLFRMTILPRPKRGGFVVVHSLRVETPHARTPLPPSEAYVGADDSVTLCFHCRRTRRENDPARWDWVPGHLADERLRITNSVCPPCRSYFYGLVDNVVRPSSLLTSKP